MSYKPVVYHIKKPFNSSLYEQMKNAPRSRFELWSDRWNHTGAMIRTIASLISAFATILTLLKVFGKI